MRLLSFSLFTACALATPPAVAGAPVHVRQEFEAASQKLGIKLNTETNGYPITTSGGMLRCLPPDEGSFEKIRPWMERELGRYPDGFLRRNGIREIVLCRQVEMATRNYGGIALPGKGKFYVQIHSDVDRGSKTLHHEIFHVIDEIPDREWTELNPEGFQYQRAFGYERPRGTVSGYGGSASREDRAEVFAFLMASKASVKRWAADDLALRRKVEKLNAWLAAKSPELAKETALE